MGNLAIIPARGGSKRIPRKNIKSFLGKPIISYSIEIALNSGLFDEVMVSTDDEEIASIAKDFGAVVPFFRSDDNANDFATTVDVLKEVETIYRDQFNKTFDYICCIYPTAPLITIENLKAGFFKLHSNNADAVFPVVPFSYPIWRGVEIVEDRTSMIWKDYLNSRSQDLKQVYHDAGQWYWYNPVKIKDSFFTSNVCSIILTEETVQDIDNFVDWKLAEIKYQLMYES